MWSQQMHDAVKCPSLGTVPDILSPGSDRSKRTAATREIAVGGGFGTRIVPRGAKWSKKNGILTNPKPLELCCEMPIIHFLPVEKSKQKKTGVYTAPAYMYPVRGGAAEHREKDAKNTGSR
jgi:hypothetical protein